MMNPQVPAIERATLAAVSPRAVLELPGWLLPFDAGTVGRAKSAVPLLHSLSNADARLVPGIEAHYAARGLQPSFRLPDGPCFAAMCQELTRRGYSAQQPTLVQVGSAQAVRAVTTQRPADMADAADAAWAALFLGEGFDPVDGASRVKHLSRATGTVFASVREGGHTLAAGAGAYSHGWASVHGMRTAAGQRGRGLAGRVLAALAEKAIERGMAQVFLQVEEGNTAALALYQRAGFRTAWRYQYWRLPAA
jgi:N-acetylglutamate synthase